MANDNLTIWRGLARMWIVASALWASAAIWKAIDSGIGTFGHYARLNWLFLMQVIVIPPLAVLLLVLAVVWVLRGFSNKISFPTFSEGARNLLVLAVLLVVLSQVAIMIENYSYRTSSQGMDLQEALNQFERLHPQVKKK